MLPAGYACISCSKLSQQWQLQLLPAMQEIRSGLPAGGWVDEALEVKVDGEGLPRTPQFQEGLNPKQP